MYNNRVKNSRAHGKSKKVNLVIIYYCVQAYYIVLPARLAYLTLSAACVFTYGLERLASLCSVQVHVESIDKQEFLFIVIV